ncbi:MAG: SPOR domain-containing protein [Luteimonas sp.]
MATKRGKSQARRNNGSGGGLPGWAWLVLGVLLTIAVVMAAPRFMKSADGDGFFRPKPNPDATPARTSDDADEPVADDAGALPAPAADSTSKAKPTQYDFYTLLPGDEVRMSDAEIAATEREEAARDKAAPKPSPSTVAVASDAAPAGTNAQAAGGDAPYLLQAGAFGASGDAEATKAKAALLGLSARVESARIGERTVYRVRMGPYATASELAEAKRKLASGGLPAMAIKVK